MLNQCVCLEHTCVHELLSPCLGVHLEKERAADFFFFLREMPDIILYFVSAKPGFLDH